MAVSRNGWGHVRSINVKSSDVKNVWSRNHIRKSHEVEIKWNPDVCVALYLRPICYALQPHNAIPIQTLGYLVIVVDAIPWIVTGFQIWILQIFKVHPLPCKKSIYNINIVISFCICGGCPIWFSYQKIFLVEMLDATSPTGGKMIPRTQSCLTCCWSLR